MFQPTMAEVVSFERYMKIERHCAARTAIEYARDIERFARFIAPKPLLDAKTKHVRRFINGLMEDGSNQPQSAQRKIAALAAFYKFAKREKWRKSNPCDEIEKPKAGKRLPKCLTQDEVTVVLKAAENHGRKPFYALRDRAIMELLYGSGLRRSEVVGLDVADVELEKRMVRVRHGKGDKERYVFLGGAAEEAVRAYLEVRTHGSDALFVVTSGKRLSARQAWVIFRDIVKASGLKKHVVPHSLRHSFATHMHEAGADIMTIKELLGHSSVATTQVYTNVSLSHMRDTFERTHPRARAQ